MLRVAIIGAGPAGFFATAELLKVKGARIDLFDRLPVPFGLVRHGVAPDHPGIKSVVDRYDESALAAGARFRLLGNVQVGRDLTLDELRRRYHAVVLATGAAESRRLGIPGEDLSGVHPASDFVGWYNGHPDQSDVRVDLSAERAVVIGVGNVALDVARILLKPADELARTDISDRTLQALARRGTREVVLLGRGGCAQAAFTPPELSEVGQIEGVDLVVSAQDRELDSDTASRLARGTLDNLIERKLDAVAKAREQAQEGRKTARVRFWTSPVEFLGEGGRVVGVRVRRSPIPGRAIAPTGSPDEVVPCGLVFVSAGYRVQPLPGAPFDEALGSVPHRRGQVVRAGGGSDAEGEVPGLFVTGWAKRGPRGVIGSNKPDAQETVRTLLEAFRAGRLPSPIAPDDDVEAALASRGVPVVSYPDWKLLDGLEVEAGRPEGRPRRKFTDAASMLEALSLAHPDRPLDRDGTLG